MTADYLVSFPGLGLVLRDQSRSLFDWKFGCLLVWTAHCFCDDFVIRVGFAATKRYGFKEDDVLDLF